MKISPKAQRDFDYVQSHPRERELGVNQLNIAYNGSDFMAKLAFSQVRIVHQETATATLNEHPRQKPDPGRPGTIQLAGPPQHEGSRRSVGHCTDKEPIRCLTKWRK
jgi:hypothetical protein